MPNNINIYVQLWSKYGPVILQLMKDVKNEISTYQLSGHEFEAIGERDKAGYSFLLKVNNGKVQNDYRFCRSQRPAINATAIKDS
jgi:hypothetical protein